MRTGFLIGLLAVGTMAFAQEPPLPAPRLAKDIGPALPAPVVDLYVPPTRATQPIAATANDAYALAPGALSWQSIYAPSPDVQPILAVRGYAKSSKALFIVHQGGVAVTKTGEAPWTETKPAGFSSASFVDFIVHPDDRKVAFLVARSAAWETRDSGQFWSPWEMPGAAEKGVGAGFARVGGKPLLVYATDKAVYLSDEKFRTWTTLSREPEGPRLLRTGDGLATVQLATGALRGYDLGRPGYQLNKAFALPATGLASDQMNFGAAYLCEGPRIYSTTLTSTAQPELIHTGGSPIVALVDHPRLANGIYWAEGSLVRTMEGAAAGFPSVPVPADAYSRAGADAAELTSAGPVSDVSTEAGMILNEVMAKQPPLEEIVGAALKYSAYSAREAENWKANVRRKNLVPQLVVGGGATERGLDQHGEVVNVDRFGVPTTRGLERDDRTAYMGTYGVELRWSLSGLVFDKEQLMVSEETRKRNESRNTLIAQVTDLYYRRLEMLVRLRMHKGDGTIDDAIQSRLRLRQITDTINSLTGDPLLKDPA